MANKKLQVAGTSDLKLPTKKSKDDKKPKWQTKTGGKKGKAKQPGRDTNRATLGLPLTQIAIVACSGLAPMARRWRVRFTRPYRVLSKTRGRRRRFGRWRGGGLRWRSAADC